MLCYMFSFNLHVWSSPTQRTTPHHLLLYIFENLPWLFAARICRKNLPQEFAVAICLENLPQEFAVAICPGIFVFVSKSSFVYVSKSCFYQSKPFLYVSKTFFFGRFSLLTVFLFVIAVAVMGHRTEVIVSAWLFSHKHIKTSDHYEAIRSCSRHKYFTFDYIDTFEDIHSLITHN